LQEPGRERSGILEIGNMTKRQHKRFLGNVRGLIEIPAQPNGEGQRQVFEPIDDCGPCRAIAPLGRHDQRCPVLSIFGQGHHQEEPARADRVTAHFQWQVACLDAADERAALVPNACVL
jgi:hypothetical protein